MNNKDNDNMDESSLEAKERKPFTIRYEAPQSMEEAFQRKEELGAAILQIQSQLGSRPEDNEWRRKTKIALLCKTEELRRVKNYIRENKQTKFDALSEAVAILRGLDASGIDITERGKFILERFSTRH
jgi:hypothetical protein